MKRFFHFLFMALIPCCLSAQTIIDNVEVQDGEIEDFVGSTLQTGSSVVIRNGGDSIFWADTKIVLKPGFEAEEGSLFWGAIDSNGDGFTDVEEENAVDTDGDGLFDLWEIVYGLDENNSGDATLDNDGDGFNNLAELANGTNPMVSDNPTYDPDGDGMPSSWETSNSLSTTIDDSLGDPDNDGYPSIYEYLYGTDPQSSGSKPAASYTIGTLGDYGDIQEALIDASDKELDYVIFKLLDNTYAGTGNDDVILRDMEILHFLIIADGGPSDSTINIKDVQIIQGVDVYASEALAPLVHKNKWRLLVDQYKL